MIKITQHNYDRIHPDYKANIVGQPYMLTLDEHTWCTVLSPVCIVSAFDAEYELARRTGDARFGSPCAHEHTVSNRCANCQRVVR